MLNKRTIPRVCQRCGTNFLASTSEVNRGGARYCTHPCALMALRRPLPPVFNGDGSALIPLRGRGGVIVAYAILDAADALHLGQWSWRIDAWGYATRTGWVDGRHRGLTMHRELLALKIGDPREGDHINRNRLDNRRSNLRVVSRRENNQNRPSYRGASSAYRGVLWNRKVRKWQAIVILDGRKKHLGFFIDEQEAAKAARQGRLRLMPFAVD